MALHDAVGIDCKTDATTENQEAGVKYMGLEVWMIVCVLSDLTRLPLRGGWRKIWYIYLIHSYTYSTYCTPVTYIYYLRKK